MIRFIKPVKQKSKREDVTYDASPILDAIYPNDRNVCSHKKSCDEFISKVRNSSESFCIQVK